MSLRPSNTPTAKRGRALLLGLVLLASASVACGQVYKCKDAHGTTTYAEAPCAAQGKSLKLPQSSNGSFKDATVCAQLQDEMLRLEDAANRDARRGRPKSAAGTRRRETLLLQYHRRCAAIARSEGQRR